MEQRCAKINDVESGNLPICLYIQQFFIFNNVHPIEGNYMQYIELVIIFSVLQFLFFGVMAGKARVKFGVKAPAVTGHEGFERAYRVQMNTLELLILFIPAIAIAGKYWPATVVAGIGAVYLIGRFLYWRAYVTDPAKRAIGFMLSLLPIVALILLSLVGIAMSFAK